MNNNHILIIRFSYERIGGIENQILNLGRELNSYKDFKVSLLTDKVESPLAFEFKKYGKVYFVDIRSLPLLNVSKHIIRIIKDEKITIIQSHLFRESIICRFIKFAYPEIHHVFRAQTYIDFAKISPFKKILYHTLDFCTSRYVTIYIANGIKVSEEIINRSRVNPNKVINIINGTSVLGEPDILGKKPLTLKIAMVANLIENKGHDVLIDALALLKNRGLMIEALLIGDEISNGAIARSISFKENLINRAIKGNVIDQVNFYGYSNQIPSVLHDIPVVVLPSDSEGVPNCILEAMSLKKIVVASDVGSVGVIIDDGITGFLHPARDVQKFSDLLFMIFNEPVERLNVIREAAYSKWQNNFALNRMINSFIKIYDNI